MTCRCHELVVLARGISWLLRWRWLCSHPASLLNSSGDINSPITSNVADSNTGQRPPRVTGIYDVGVPVPLRRQEWLGRAGALVMLSAA